jgi:hypothetical protein
MGIINYIKQDPEKNKSNKKLVMQLIDDIVNGKERKPDKNDLTVQDAYYIPDNFSI